MVSPVIYKLGMEVLYVVILLLRYYIISVSDHFSIILLQNPLNTKIPMELERFGAKLKLNADILTGAMV